jgi:hypothetical protein
MSCEPCQMTCDVPAIVLDDFLPIGLYAGPRIPVPDVMLSMFD